MRKIFPFLLAFVFLLQSVSSVFATIESPPISDRASLIDFVRDCIDERQNDFVINYVHGYMGNNDDLLYSCNLPHIYSRVLKNNGKIAKVYYKITYYPGMRVADAYKSKDTSHLNDEELKLYKIASSIVHQAQNMTDLQAELFFHDTICKNVTYFTKANSKVMPRHATAIGAFLDRRANCQGYCDAFYMLCTMFGFSVDMQSGRAAKQRHVWNVIEIGKKWYAVDVTWDDNDAKKNQNFTFVSHKYFNAPEEIMKETHSWNEEDETQQITTYLDEKYFYCTDEVDDYTFGNFFNTMDDAITYITSSLIEGRRSLRVMSRRDDKRYDQIKFINAQINKKLQQARIPISFYTIVQKHGEYLYIAIDVKS